MQYSVTMMETPLYVSQARQNLAEKRRHAYKIRDKAAVKIQRWYRSFKTTSISYVKSGSDSSRGELSVPCSKEGSRYGSKISESGSSFFMGHQVQTVTSGEEIKSKHQPLAAKRENSLEDFVNNEVAIALALANQKPISSLTPNQQERVRQLRARVTPKETEKLSVTRSTKAKSKQKSSGSRLKLPSVKVKREMDSIPATNEIPPTKSESTNNSKATKEPSIQVENVQDRPLNGGKQLMKKCEQSEVLNDVHNQRTISKDGRTMQVKKKDMKVDRKDMQQQNVNAINVLHRSDIRQSESKTVTKPLLQKHTQLKQHLKPPAKVKKHHSSTTNIEDYTVPHQKVMNSLKSGVNPSGLLEEDNMSASNLIQPGKTGHINKIDKHDNQGTHQNKEINILSIQSTQQSRIPVPVKSHVDRNKINFSDISKTQDGKIDGEYVQNEFEIKGEDTLVQWEEPLLEEYTTHATYQETGQHSKEKDSTNHEQVQKTEQQNLILHHDAPSSGNHYPEDTPQERGTQLYNDKKAHALLNFAQELVIKDFLEWKNGSTIPHNEQQHDRAPYVNWQRRFPVHQLIQSVEYEGSEPEQLYVQSKTQTYTAVPQHSMFNQTQPILHEMQDSLFDQSTPELSQRARQSKEYTWQSSNTLIAAPQMVDTAVQTDSTGSDKASLTQLLPSLLPPIGQQRPHNQGGHSRPTKRDTQKDDRGFVQNGLLIEGFENIGKHWKPLNDRQEKGSIKSLKSPTLKPSKKKQTGGYLSKYLNSDNHGGHMSTKSAPGGYYHSPPPFVPWYGTLNNTAPPSLLGGDSPLHLNRSHQRKLSSGPHVVYPQRMHHRLKPIQHPSTNYSHSQLFDNDPFQSLDTMYKHQYHHRRTL